jgi:hypothetical protein
MPDGFPAYLDIAASRDQAANFISFLQEGLFFDQYTREAGAYTRPLLSST